MVRAFASVCIVSLIALAGWSPGANAGEVDKFCSCPTARTPPVVDGSIDESEWALSPWQSGFAIPNSRNLAPAQTKFRVARSANDLYIAIEAKEPEMDRVKAKETQRDTEVALDDCVEVGIDPPHDHLTHYHFIVNPRGALLDFRNGFYSAWDANVRVGVKRLKDRWTVEMAIRLVDLAQRKPKSADVWGFNVYRERQASGSTELSNWAESTGIFTVSRQMGHLVFGFGGFSFAKAHQKFLKTLTPELARSPNGFEGRPWTFLDNELSEDHDLASSLKSTGPHVRPSAAVRALVFIGARGDGRNLNPGTAVRDAVELVKRYGFDATAVFVNSRGLVGEARGERRLRYLLKDSYNAFVFGHCSPADLPKPYQEEIERRLNAGAGVVCVSDDSTPSWFDGRRTFEPGDFSSTLPVPELSAFQAIKPTSDESSRDYEPIQSFSCGHGRAVSIRYPGVNGLTPEMPATRENVLEYGYWIDIVGQAVQWASRSEPAGRVQVPSMTVGRSQLPQAVPLEIRPLPDQQHKPAVLLRDMENTTELAVNTTPEGIYEAELPELPAGRYWLEVYSAGTDGQQQPVSALGRLQVVQTTSQMRISIDRALFKEDENVTGSIHSGQGTAVRITLENFDGDWLASKTLPRSTTETRFSIPLTGRVTANMTLRVESLSQDKVLETQSIGVKAQRKRTDDFHGVMWDQPDGPMGLLAFRNLREKAGFDVVLDGAIGEAALGADYMGLPYTTRITNTRKPDGVMTWGCWNDPAAVRRRIDTVIDKQKINAANGVWCYSLGDENDTMGCCLHPDCLAAYRRYLQQQYGSISALNESWGERYQSFEDVQLLRGDDVFKDGQAFQTGKYPRWLDRQKFARLNYARLCKRYAEAYDEIDPGAITGFEGTGRFGEDPDALLGSVGMWTTYNNIFDDILRTLIPPEFIHSIWVGYQKDADSLLAASWRALALGADSYWWWRWDGIGFYRGFARPTLDLWPATQAVADDFEVVRNGLGKLLTQAAPVDDGVAILYSVEGVLSDEIPSEHIFGKAEYAHAAFIHMLKDSGVGYRYVTPERIRAGGLRGTKLLILPHAFAVDTTTAAMIQDFARSGGTIVADQRPGVYDGHLKAVRGGMLQALFGSPETWHKGVRVDTLYGKGHGVLLNRSVIPYETNRSQLEARKLRSILADICRGAGVDPFVDAVDPKGASPLMTELTSLRLERGGQLLCVRRDSIGWEFTGPGPLPEPYDYPVRITLKEPRYVYDLRSGRSLGLTRSFRCDLRGGRANFYGVFETPVLVASASARKVSSDGADQVDAQAMLNGSDTALQFSLLSPSGEELPWSKKVVTSSGNKAQARWMLPLNRLPPARVKVKELFTGKAAVADIIQ
ncbi:MAG: beta-galactosidase [Armatimonadetes bacterium]|nr:beta-galactosidase [Armatimonadota bacterium]